MRFSRTLFLLLCVSVRAQTPAVSKSFVIADVHTSPFSANPFMHGNSIQGDRYFVLQATMVDLIATAYGIDASNVQGGPAWLERDRYDISAEVPAKTTQDDVKFMLRSLLADRFHLVVKTASMPLPAYALSVGPGKAKMIESDGTGEGSCMPAPPENTPPGAPSYISIQCKNLTMAALADTLQSFAGGYLGEPVVDETHLAGGWNFTLKWSHEGELAKQGAAGISIFAAVEKQLGLKLDLKTAPRPVFQVASVDEAPTPNAVNIAAALPEPPPSAFEVTVIRPSAPDEQGYGHINGGEIDIRATPLLFLMTFAWNLNPENKEGLVNAPKWLDTKEFDITGKAGANVRVDTFSSGTLINLEDLRSMLRAMIADRFQMKWHMEDRVVTAYTLVAVKPKLKLATDATERTRCREGKVAAGEKDPRIANPVLNRLVTCQNMTMAQIADELQRVADGYIFNPVVDGTGLKGSYDFTLSFSSADRILSGAGGESGSSSDPNGAVSIFDAVSRQLGLKLEKTKRPYPVLVIDHMEETPTEN